jgi:hypothetical protein
MSSIPYNYGKYIDDKVSMTKQGHVGASKQIQSPASAGSRGLAKTTQFTNNPTQMQMGNSPIAESMVEIRNILNRIDGVNVPVQEAEHISPEIKSQGMRDFLDVIIDKDEPNVYDQMDDSAKILYKYNSMTGNKLSREQIDMLTDLRQKDDVEFEKQLTKAGVDLEKLGQVAKQYKDDPYESEVQEAPKQKAMSVDKIYDMVQNLEHVIQQHPDFKDYDKSIIMASLGQLKDDIAAGDLKETSVKEDDGDERAIAAMKLAKDENRKEGFDYPQGGKYGYKAERGSGTGAMGTMQVNVTIHDRETDETMYIKDMNYLELEKGDEQETLAMIWDENRDLIQKEDSDSDELGRLKELSGIEEEDAGLTDQQKQGLKTVYEKYKNRKGYNGDVLPIGYLDYNVDTGIWFDGADEKEVEAAMKKLGHADMDAWEEAAEGEEYEQFLELAPITGQMIGDLSDVLGDNFTSNDALMKAALAYMNSIDESYEPFPEADEFDINEDEDFEEVLGPLGFPEDELWEAEYRGRKVPLNKPMRGDVKKFKVYVKDPKSGNIKKVNFGHGGTSAKKLGQKTMKIRKSNPKARKSFRARHNCANPGPKTKARYWSCRKW